MKLTNFIWIVLGLLIWDSSFILITPCLVAAQDKEVKSREVTKALMKEMITDPLPPGIAPEKLPEPNSLGAKHLQKYCSQCHDIFSPRMHSPEKWSSLFQRVSCHMQKCSVAEKIGRIVQIETPTPQEEVELLSYLKRHSLHAADQSKLEHLDTPSGIAFLQTCTQCHALPDPKQHATQEWPGVVTRMNQNMQQMRKSVIQPKKKALILLYLLQSASQ